MKMNVTFLLAALCILFISVSCQSLGDLKNAFDSGLSGMSSQVKDAVAAAQTQLQNVFSGTNPKEALTNLGTKVGEMSTQVKDAVSNAQGQLQTAASGNGAQVTAVKDALTNVGTKIVEAINNTKLNVPKSFATTFWDNDVATKFQTSAKKLLDFKDIDAKYTAPKTELATYMVNAKSTPNITDMINLARKHLSADEAIKFFDQMASIAEQQKW